MKYAIAVAALLTAASIGYATALWLANRRLAPVVREVVETSAETANTLRAMTDELTACRAQRDMWQRHALAAERIAEAHGVTIPEWDPGQ